MTPGVAFDTLLAQLRGEGFTIGIDRILQIERLLQGPGSRVAPNRLKQLMGPLLANTAEQQERFEVLYDQFFGFAPAPVQNKPVKPDPEAPGWWKWILAGLAVVALSALLAVRAMYPEPVPPRPPGAPALPALSPAIRISPRPPCLAPHPGCRASRLNSTAAVPPFNMAAR